jgi:hypothetical protein
MWRLPTINQKLASFRPKETFSSSISSRFCFFADTVVFGQIAYFLRNCRYLRNLTNCINGRLSCKSYDVIDLLQAIKVIEIGIAAYEKIWDDRSAQEKEGI